MNAAAVAWPVNIGMASRMSGVTPKMVRHYESLGLLHGVARTDSGYRQYTEADVHTLRFIKRARELGFPMADIHELVSLWHNRRRASGNVKRIAQKHSDELALRIEAMQAMQRTLAAPHPLLPGRRAARLPDPRRPGGAARHGCAVSPRRGRLSRIQRASRGFTRMPNAARTAVE